MEKKWIILCLIIRKIYIILQNLLLKHIRTFSCHNEGLKTLDNKIQRNSQFLSKKILLFGSNSPIINKNRLQLKLLLKKEKFMILEVLNKSVTQIWNDWNFEHQSQFKYSTFLSILSTFCLPPTHIFPCLS